MSLKPFFVMRVTQTGDRIGVSTRFGRWFGSQEAAAKLAMNIKGQVYRRDSNGVSRLVQDCTGAPLNQDQLDGWEKGRAT